MEIQEKAWVHQITGTKVQDDDFICVIGLEPMNEVNSSAITGGPTPHQHLGYRASVQQVYKVSHLEHAA